MENKICERALVIDDNPAALMAVSRLLQSIGFEVDEADGPRSALEATDKRSFDLVVSDINMPGDINGIQLAQILRKKNTKLQIILMTGFNENLSAGSGEFTILAKPFALRELKAALNGRRHMDA